MQNTDDNLKRLAFSALAIRRQSGWRASESRDRDKEADNKGAKHLLYLGKILLPHHPIRMRHLPYSSRRILLYGSKGYQEMKLGQTPEIYSMKAVAWRIKMSDCVETSGLLRYTVARSHNTAVLACYDARMLPLKIEEVPYPMGCLSAIAANRSGSHLYGTNEELNCVLRFSGNDLSLAKAERFGALWRPFDCCTSQVFARPDGTQAEYLFVSNFDAGIFAFDADTMDIVADCGDDLSPGAKYLAYDPKRCFLFVSSASERLLRCYRFEPPQSPREPGLHKVGDFLVAAKKSAVRSSGPQCVMWDPERDHLVVISWARAHGKFMTKVFRVNA